MKIDRLLYKELSKHSQSTVHFLYVVSLKNSHNHAITFLLHNLTISALVSDSVLPSSLRVTPFHRHLPHPGSHSFFLLKVQLFCPEFLSIVFPPHLKGIISIGLHVSIFVFNVSRPFQKFLFQSLKCLPEHSLVPISSYFLLICPKLFLL